MFAICLSRCTVVLTNLILRKIRFHTHIVNCRLRITLSSFNFSWSSKHTTCNFRYRHRDQDARLKIKKVYFFWICPDTNAFEWFSDLLQSLEQQVRTEFMLLLLVLCLGIHVRVRFYKFMFVFAYILWVFLPFQALETQEWRLWTLLLCLDCSPQVDEQVNICYFLFTCIVKVKIQLVCLSQIYVWAKFNKLIVLI